MIILAATPIGNLGDASQRLKDALASATLIACEDTRTTGQLIHLLGITGHGRMVSLHEHNERDRVAEIVQSAHDGDVLVVSDAGMPTVSDPGFLLVRQAIAEGVRVSVLPGPSAPLAALAISGLPTDRFCFEGFLPRKSSDRGRALTALCTEPRTMIFFESPHRLADTLEAMSAAFGGDRSAVVVREITKMYEEAQRGTIAELVAWARAGVRGEIVVVVAGAVPVTVGAEQAASEVQDLVAAGTRLKDAAAQVAERHGLSKRDLYQAALETKRPSAAAGEQ